MSGSFRSIEGVSVYALALQWISSEFIVDIDASIGGLLSQKEEGQSVTR